MATSTQDVREEPAFDLSAGAARWSGDDYVLRRRRRWLSLLIWTAVLGGGGWAAMHFLHPLEWLLGASAVERKLPTHKVARGDLLVTVTEDGTVESASNVDIKCEVAGGSTILWIIKDGTQVTEGEELVKLDSSTIEDQINAQKITWEKAKAAVVEAEKNFSAAKIGVQEYLEGTYVKDLQLADANVTIAMENLRSSENQFLHTQKMSRKGYVTSLQRDAQAFAVERAKLELQAQKTAKEVLEKFTRPKMVEDLESKRDTAEALMRSNQAAFDLEEARLKRLNTQLEKCVVKAPAPGMVVYANESQGGRFGGQQGPQIEEGATVRERQSIIRLPDLSKMQVKVTVHESKVQNLTKGMRAHIRWQDEDLQGYVYSIANQAEPFNFFSPNAKKYATIVRIEGRVPAALKPGMTAIVEILVANLKDVLTVPDNSIVEIGSDSFCWIETANGPEQRKLELGIAGTTSVEVKEGVKEGEFVILNPRAVIANAKEEAKKIETIDVKKRFGEGNAVAPAGGSPSPNGSGTSRGERGRRGEGGPPSDAAAASNGERPRFDPMQFDQDGDKKLSKDEAPEQMKDRFDSIDENQDGFLDQKELAAMRRRFQQRGGAGGPPGGGPPE